MSFTHFDEVYEICCGMTAEEAVLVKAKPEEEMFDIMKDILPEASLWREAELINAHDREGELLHV